MDPREQKETKNERQRGEAPLFNRTGIMTHPDLSAEMIRGAEETLTDDGDPAEMASMRAQYLSEAVSIGSPPVIISSEPGEAEEEQLSEEADRMSVFLDKLGERLAFERQGSRLYETVLQKIESVEISGDGGPSTEDLQHICEEEKEHFKLLQKAISDMGGDATVQTPSADVAGVLSHGVVQIVTDPRTTMAHTLQAMLNAELADNDGWQLLIELAAELGYSDLEEQFQQALKEEEEHLENVRGWLSSVTVKEAMGESALLEGASVDGEKGEKEQKHGTQKQKGRARKKKTKGSRESKSKKR
jgi:hypothetical protein